MSNKIDLAVEHAIAIAKDDSHGYDQIDRWGEYGDYDCSSIMYTVWDLAGVPVKRFGLPMYSETIYNHFTQSGFEDVTSQVNFANLDGLQKGDMLLNTVHHTAIYIGGGQIVEAQWSENHTAYGYAGDQTGEEIWIRSYYNYPWEYCLRFTEDGKPDEMHTQYQAYISSGWLSEITDCNQIDHNGYAGIPGMPLYAFRCKADCNLEYRVHCVDDGWYNWRINYDVDSDGDYYAGDLNHMIDALQIKKPNGYNVHYRVHDTVHGWLPWVDNCNFEDYNGYAGWIGNYIDLVQIYLTKE